MTSLYAAYALFFSRVCIGLIFFLSSIYKLKDFSSFKQTVRDFQVLPDRIVNISALVLLAGELFVVELMFAKGKAVAFGFGAAFIILCLFSTVLISGLVKKLHLSCNCFGKSHQSISAFEVGRNLVFLGISVLGFASYNSTADNKNTLNLIELAVLGLMATTMIILLAYGRELFENALEL